MPLIHHVVTGKAVRQSSSSTDLAALTATGTLRCPICLPAVRPLLSIFAVMAPALARRTSVPLEQFGTDVAEVMQTLALPSAVLVGHSMGCRVVVEAAFKATAV